MDFSPLTSIFSSLIILLNLLLLIFTKIKKLKENQKLFIYLFSLSFIFISFAILLLQQSSKNHPPKINALISNPPIIQTGGKAEITIIAFDQDEGDNLIYLWSASSGEIRSGMTVESSVVFNAPDTKSTVTISVIVSDLRGGTAKRSINLPII